MRSFYLFFVLAFTAMIAQSADSICSNLKLASVPILAEGRIKPLSVHASEFVKKNFKFQCPYSYVEFYCRLSIDDFKENQGACSVRFPVDHQKIKQLLKMTSENFVSPEVIEKRKFEIRTELNNEQAADRAESGYAIALSKILLSYQNYLNLSSGQDWKILDSHGQWIDVAGFLKEKSKKELIDQLLVQGDKLSDADKRKLNYEIIYESLNLFLFSLFIAISGFILSLVSLRLPKFNKAVKILSYILFASLCLSMILRTLISGRAPVTNMFETVLWTAMGVLFFGIWLTLVMKSSLYLVVGFAANVVFLFMMKFATGMLDSAIRPLVPVLRDNFWLSTHVTTITLSYASFALSWFLANYVLIGFIFKKMNPKMINNVNEALRLIIQVGSVLLAAGIILGGIWADYSWGRFWGWDPKETWSLIALIIYMAILHGKYAGWFKDISFTLVNAMGFQFVLMAWFGVNYILASGLHSYGFSQGGSLFLISIFTVQLLIVLLVLWRKKTE